MEGQIIWGMAIGLCLAYILFSIFKLMVYGVIAFVRFLIEWYWECKK